MEKVKTFTKLDTLAKHCSPPEKQQHCSQHFLSSLLFFTLIIGLNKGKIRILPKCCQFPIFLLDIFLIVQFFFLFFLVCFWIFSLYFKWCCYVYSLWLKHRSFLTSVASGIFSNQYRCLDYRRAISLKRAVFNTIII